MPAEEKRRAHYERRVAGRRTTGGTRRARQMGKGSQQRVCDGRTEKACEKQGNTKGRKHTQGANDKANKRGAEGHQSEAKEKWYSRYQTHRNANHAERHVEVLPRFSSAVTTSPVDFSGPRKSTTH